MVAAIDPFAITAMWFVPTLERGLPGTGNLTAISIMDLNPQAVLDIEAQLRLSHQFGWLGSSGNQFRLPLRDRSPNLGLPTMSCSVTCQLP